MATINYLIQSKKNPATIYIRLRDGSKVDIKVPTSMHVDPENWSLAKKTLKSSRTAELKALSTKMEDLRAKVISHLNTRKSEVILDKYWLSNIVLDQISKNEVPDGLVEYADYFIKCTQTSSSLRTVQKHQLVRELLSDFSKYSNKKFRVVDVNRVFQTQFTSYLSTHRHYRQTTLHRTISFLKTICRHARTHGIETSYELDNLGVKDGKALIVTLNKAELNLIKEVKLDFNYLENARQWLLLSCSLGQRGGDFLSLTSKQIKEFDGVKLVDMRQQKGNKELFVLLTDEANEILEENGGEFPRKISTQNYNKYIKEVCKLAGLNEMVRGSKIDEKTKRKTDGIFEKWELITSHVGRRSFATNYYGIIPTPLLMAQTGHTTENQFLKYIGKGRVDMVLELSNALKNVK